MLLAGWVRMLPCKLDAGREFIVVHGWRDQLFVRPVVVLARPVYMLARVCRRRVQKTTDRGWFVINGTVFLQFAYVCS